MSEKRKITPKEAMSRVLTVLGIFAISLLPIAGGGANSVNAEITKDGIPAVPAPLKAIDMRDVLTGTPTRIARAETPTPVVTPIATPSLPEIPVDQRP